MYIYYKTYADTKVVYTADCKCSFAFFNALSIVFMKLIHHKIVIFTNTVLVRDKYIYLNGVLAYWGL